MILKDLIRGLILHRSLMSFVDSIVTELLVEEIRLQSYSEKKILCTSNPSVLTIPSKPFSNNKNKLTQGLPSTSADFVSIKVIGRLTVPI